MREERFAEFGVSSVPARSPYPLAGFPSPRASPSRGAFLLNYVKARRRLGPLSLAGQCSESPARKQLWLVNAARKRQRLASAAFGEMHREAARTRAHQPGSQLIFWKRSHIGGAAAGSCPVASSQSNR